MSNDAITKMDYWRGIQPAQAWPAGGGQAMSASPGRCGLS